MWVAGGLPFSHAGGADERGISNGTAEGTGEREGGRGTVIRHLTPPGVPEGPYHSPHCLLDLLHHLPPLASPCGTIRTSGYLPVRCQLLLVRATRWGDAPAHRR